MSDSAYAEFERMLMDKGSVYLNTYNSIHTNAIINFVETYVADSSYTIVIHRDIHDVDTVKEYLKSQPDINIFLDTKVSTTTSKNENMRILWGLGKSTGSIGFYQDIFYSNAITDALRLNELAQIHV